MCLPLPHATRGSVLLLLMSAKHLFEKSELPNNEGEVEREAQKQSVEQHVAEERYCK